MSGEQYQPGEVLPGTVYRVVRHLATGGMGSVYDVEDTTVEKRYVLKTLHPQLIAREDLARRMRDEAKSLARLQHPNIVDVITAGVTTDAQKMPFYVMERLIGHNLRTVLEKKRRLEPNQALPIALDIASALEHAHEKAIVHRDVKPENVFLHRHPNGTTVTKLLDFGIVRLLDRKASHTHGKFVGTLRYASPEQIMGHPVGPTTDIYSLGVVLFEMVAGRGPFDESGDAYAIGAAHASAVPPPVSRFARVTRELEVAIARMLAKDPAQRPASCFAVATELRRCLQAADAQASSATVMNVFSQAVDTRAPSTAVMAQGPFADATFGSAPTAHGMIPPSMIASAEVLPETRGEGRVSPVASTLAAASLTAVSPVRPQSEGGSLPELVAGAPPRASARPMNPAFGPTAPTLAAAGVSPPSVVVANDVLMPVTQGLRASAPPAVDRNAPTRAGADPVVAPRPPQNDTHVAQSLLPDHLRGRSAPQTSGARVGGPAAVGALQATTAPPFQPGDTNTTSPLSGDARTRPPDRMGQVLFALAAVGAVVLAGVTVGIVRHKVNARMGRPETSAVVPSPSSTDATTLGSVPAPAGLDPSPPIAIASGSPTPLVPPPGSSGSAFPIGARPAASQGPPRSRPAARGSGYLPNFD